MITKHIISPVLTEKSSRLVSSNVFTFYIEELANKIQIEQELKKKFSVIVESVNTVQLPSKKVRRGRIVGRKSGKRKAYIRLSPDQDLDEIKKLF